MQDLPLGQIFDQNPYQYLQNYVRNLNNQIFLSQFHINNLYVLLLIGRNSPWDNIKGSQNQAKIIIDNLLTQRVNDVKKILQSLSNAYEDKTKKNTINQIEKLMGILKAKNKKIFIQKTHDRQSIKKFQNMIKFVNQAKQQLSKDKSQRKKQNQNNNQDEFKQKMQQQNPSAQFNDVPEKQKHEQQCQCVRFQHNQNHEQMIQQKQMKQEKIQQKIQQEKPSLFGNKQVLTIFLGLSNVTNLTSMALTNIIQFNPHQRFLKFKMSQNYNMTIFNKDPLYLDKTSKISKIPQQLFINHIFQFLSASQLFRMRSVCKQWFDHVRDTWHSTFKRQMFVQLLACQFCKDIEYQYKMIQLRNPFFQKLSLLIHALIQIIDWQAIKQTIINNTLTIQTKRILIIILRLIGQKTPFTNINSINDAFFNQEKHRLNDIKLKLSSFFSRLQGSEMSVNQLRSLKVQFLDDQFMRIDDPSSEDKGPLLLTILAKQITLQQILRNHVFLAQQYLVNTKKRLDNISSKMRYQKGYLQGIYKILLLKNTQSCAMDNEPTESPNFLQMIQSIFTNRNHEKPDFVIRGRTSSTQIFMDNGTKLDIILSTFNRPYQSRHHHEQHHIQNEQKKQQSMSQQNNTQIKKSQQDKQTKQ